jgi:hypothetical protein
MKILFFCAPWAYYTVFSGAGVVSGTLHPAVWDTHMKIPYWPKCCPAISDMKIWVFVMPRNNKQTILI